MQYAAPGVRGRISKAIPTRSTHFVGESTSNIVLSFPGERIGNQGIRGQKPPLDGAVDAAYHVDRYVLNNPLRHTNPTGSEPGNDRTMLQSR